MTAEEIKKISELRSEGLNYVKIAEALGISQNTVKSYCRRHGLDNTPRCRCCGKPVKQTKGKRARKYCSDVCKTKWWNEHRDDLNQKDSNKHVCPECGTVFYGYGHRIYCSVKCYADARRKKDA